MTDIAGDRLRVLLQRAVLPPERFAHRLNLRAGQMGLPARIDRKTPYKWLRGGHPRDPWPALAAAVLGEVLGTEVTPEDLGWRPSRDGAVFVAASSGLVTPWTSAGGIDAMVEVAEATAMDRRIFLQLTGAALTQPALEWLIAAPILQVANDIGRRVGDAHVDGIEDIAGRLRRMDDEFGGGAVLELVRGHIRFMLNLLRNHSYSDRVGRRLHGAAGELLRLGGWLSFDAGQHVAAQRYWVAALHAAHSAGDRSLGANILGFMSCQAKDLELYPEAVRLAEAAKVGYQGASPRVRTILCLRVAEAHAQTGDVGRCRAAIDGGYEALRGTPSESGEPAWSYWLDEAQVNAQAGYCFTRLGDWTRARSHLLAALRLQEDSYGREGALRRALLATVYARQGDPEQACETAGKALDILAEDVDSARCVVHVRRVRAALDPYRKVAVVRDFHERAGQLLGGF